MKKDKLFFINFLKEQKYKPYKHIISQLIRLSKAQPTFLLIGKIFFFIFIYKDFIIKKNI